MFPFLGRSSRPVSTAHRSRLLPAPPRTVWAVVEDPHQLSGWWPAVERVEGVEEGRFTEILRTRRGRPVRADFHVLTSEPPGARGGAFGRLSWTQDLIGTPFERVLQESVTEILLEPLHGGTRVTIEQRQRLRGYSRTGALMIRHTTADRLDEALAGLERICVGEG